MLSQQQTGNSNLISALAMHFNNSIILAYRWYYNEFLLKKNKKLALSLSRDDTLAIARSILQAQPRQLSLSDNEKHQICLQTKEILALSDEEYISLIEIFNHQMLEKGKLQEMMLDNNICAVKAFVKEEYKQYKDTLLEESLWNIVTEQTLANIGQMSPASIRSFPKKIRLDFMNNANLWENNTTTVTQNQIISLLHDLTEEEVKIILVNATQPCSLEKLKILMQFQPVIVAEYIIHNNFRKRAYCLLNELNNNIQPISHEQSETNAQNNLFQHHSKHQLMADKLIQFIFYKLPGNYDLSTDPLNYKANKLIIKHITIDYWENFIKYANRRTIDFLFEHAFKIAYSDPQISSHTTLHSLKNTLKTCIIKTSKRGQFSPQHLVNLLAWFQENNKETYLFLLSEVVPEFLKHNMRFSPDDIKNLNTIVMQAQTQVKEFKHFALHDGIIRKATNPLLKALYKNKNEDKWKVISPLYLSNPVLAEYFLNQESAYTTPTQPSLLEYMQHGAFVSGIIGWLSSVFTVSDHFMGGSKFGLIVGPIVATAILMTGDVAGLVAVTTLMAGAGGGMVAGAFMGYMMHKWRGNLIKCCRWLTGKLQDTNDNHKILTTLEHASLPAIQRCLFEESPRTRVSSMTLRENLMRMLTRLEDEGYSISNVHPVISSIKAAIDWEKTWHNGYMGKTMWIVSHRVVGLVLGWPWLWGYQAMNNQAQKNANIYQETGASETYIGSMKSMFTIFSVTAATNSPTFNSSENQARSDNEEDINLNDVEISDNVLPVNNNVPSLSIHLVRSNSNPRTEHSSALGDSDDEKEERKPENPQNFSLAR
jgi:hypothetical protein